MEERVTPLRPVVSVAAMRSRRKQVTAQTEYGAINVVYRPGAISTPMIKRFKSAGDDPDVVIPIIADLIADWDVYEDEEGTRRVSPTDAEAVAMFDVPGFLAPVIEAVMDDMQPGKPSATGSFGG
jgi:hypothetical protein